MVPDARIGALEEVRDDHPGLLLVDGVALAKCAAKGL